MTARARRIAGACAAAVGVVAAFGNQPGPADRQWEVSCTQVDNDRVDFVVHVRGQIDAVRSSCDCVRVTEGDETGGVIHGSIDLRAVRRFVVPGIYFNRQGRVVFVPLECRTR